MGFTLNQLEQEKQIKKLQKKGNTADYKQLSNLPCINNIELKGNKTGSDLGITDHSDVATEFNEATAYTAGCYVYHEGMLYIFNVDHAVGAWDPSEVAESNVTDEVTSNKAAIVELEGEKVDKSDIAHEFNTTTAYSKGDLCYYQGTLYEFNQAHAAGAWNSAEVDAKNISDVIAVDKTVISATTNQKLNLDAWVKKCGSVVCIQLAGTKNVSADNITELFTIDTKYRPSNQITVDGVIPDATTLKTYRVKVTTAGKVTIYLYGSTPENSQSNIQPCITYVV